MFSGIVQSLGTIVSISEAGEIVTLEVQATEDFTKDLKACLLYTSPSPRDGLLSRMPSSA